MKRSIIYSTLLAICAGLPATAAADGLTALPSAMLEGLDEYFDETSGYYFKPLDGTQFGDWIRSKYGNYLFNYENICALTGMEKTIVERNINAHDAGYSTPDAIEMNGIRYIPVCIDGLDYEGMELRSPLEFSTNFVVYVGEKGIRNINPTIWYTLNVHGVENDGLRYPDNSIVYPAAMPPRFYTLDKNSDIRKLMCESYWTLSLAVDYGCLPPYDMFSANEWGPFLQQCYYIKGWSGMDASFSAVGLSCNAMITSIHSGAEAAGNVTIPSTFKVLAIDAVGNYSYPGPLACGYPAEYIPLTNDLTEPIKRLTLEEGIRIVMPEAFKGMEIEEIVLPSSLEYICQEAFADVRGLKRVICNWDEENPLIVASYNAFSGIPSDAVLVGDFANNRILNSAPFSSFASYKSIADFTASVADATLSEAEIICGNGELTVNASGEEIAVYTADGTLCARGHGHLTAPLPSGVYIVKAGNAQATKALVR